MSKKECSPNTEPEIKQRIPVWLYPSTLEVLDAHVQRDNCKSRSEFIEKAVRFYAGYVSGEEAAAFLPVALVSALRGVVQNSENRIARLLFKLAVEDAMMMNVLAAGLDVAPEDLDQLRDRCVQEVKKTGGAISFKDAAKYQRGDD